MVNNASILAVIGDASQSQYPKPLPTYQFSIALLVAGWNVAFASASQNIGSKKDLARKVQQVHGYAVIGSQSQCSGKPAESALAATGQLVQHIPGTCSWSCYLQMCACVAIRSMFHASLHSLAGVFQKFLSMPRFHPEICLKLRGTSPDATLTAWESLLRLENETLLCTWNSSLQRCVQRV